MDGYGKISGGGAAGAGALLIVWAWNSFMPAHPMPAEVGSALTILLMGLGVYFTPHGAVGGT